MEYSGGANGLFLGGAAVPEMCYQILASARNPGKYQTILSPRPILCFQRATNEYIAATFSALSTRARGLEEDAHNGLSGWEN